MKSLVSQHPTGTMFLGCGWGEELVVVSEPSVAVDISFSALAKARHRWADIEHRFVQADATKLPFKDGSFDCIICATVLELIPAPERVIRQCHDLLRKDGVIILEVPNWLSPYGLFRKLYEIVSGKRYFTEDAPHDLWYTVRTIKRLLAQGPFTVVGVRGCWYYPPVGLRNFRLPEVLVIPVIWFFMPINRLFGRVFPSLGASLFVVAVKK